MAVMEAQQWCDKPENKQEMSEIVGKRQWFNVPVADIVGRAKGDINYGNGRVENGTKQFMKFWQDHASYPFKSHDTWFVTEDIRWGKFEPTTDIKALVDKVNREDLWREAAKALAVAGRRHPDLDVTRQGDVLRRQGVRSGRNRPPTSRACRSSGLKFEGHRRRDMNMPVLKTEPQTIARAPSATVVALNAPTPGFLRSRILPAARTVAVSTLPPLVMLCILLGLWQMLCMKPGATLPSPTKIWSDAHDLIVDPFFVAGPQDIGLGWRVLTSLQRVAIGFGLAAIVGRADRHHHRPIGLGDARARSDLPSAAHDAAARLAADVARCVSRQPAVGDLRDLHHFGLADHHQHRGRHSQHSAGLSQRRRRAAAQPARVLLEDHDPAAAPYIFTGLRIGIGLSWLAIVAAEMLTGGVGIGFFIWDAWNSSRLSDIVVALAYIGVVGFLLDRLVAGIATVVTRGTAAN